MTDRTPESSREDRAIEQALSRAMATGNEPRLLPGGEEADAGLVREYTELLGLLPYELRSETPSPRVKSRILDLLTGSESPPRNQVPDSVQPAPVATFSVPTVQVRSSWASLPMAAMFAVFLLGAGFLGGLAWKQSREIHQMRGDLLAANAFHESRISDLTRELVTQRSHVEMITTVARKAYPMRTVAQVASTGAQQPEGIVYVCGRHQRWYLNLRGLEPPAEGDAYRLWFMTDEGKIDGGIVDVKPDSSTEMEDFSMPSGVRGFEVTLEKQGAPEGPESLTILLGENPVNL